MLHITMVSPTLPAARTGNGISAARWARRLRELGHRVRIVQTYDGKPCDVLVALHARKSARAGFDFKRAYPDRPLIVALTGTDLYIDLQRSAAARRLLEHAAAFVLLQPLGLDRLPAKLQRRAHVIYQSAVPPARRPRASERTFDVAVLAHARPVKDPMRAAMAARRLPPESRLRVVHAGRALSRTFATRIEREMHRNPRYRWIGDVSHAKALGLLARSRALVASSIVEGGANVVSEAAVLHVPVLASRIPGSLGLLGDDYPGYFRVRDTAGLAALLERLEGEPAFQRRLKSRMRRLAPRFHPDRERQAWKRLIDGLR